MEELGENGEEWNESQLDLRVGRVCKRKRKWLGGIHEVQSS